MNIKRGYLRSATLLAGLMVVILSVVFARNICIESEYRIMGGILEQVVSFQIRIRAYFLDHGHPPAQLADVLAVNKEQDELWFGTPQEVRCHLIFVPHGTSNSTIVRITCGVPPLAYYEITGDGEGLKETRHRQFSVLRLRQKRADYPLLKTYFFDHKAE